MKKIWLVPCAVLFVLSAGCTAQAEESVSSASARAFSEAGIPVLRRRADPVDFSLSLLSGGEAKLSACRGKVVFLNFWATWCPPCRAEMPAMENLFRRFAGRGLEMIAVNCAEPAAVAAAFVAEAEYTFPVALDINGTVSGRYNISAIPATYILDRDGKIIVKVTGSLRWDDPKITAAFETLLGE